jgi:hypothetical protein
MKLIFTSLFFSLIFFFGSGANAAGIITPSLVSKTEALVKKSALSYKQVKKMLEQSLGRKLTFKEKMAARIHTTFPSIGDGEGRRANNQAVTGFIFSVCGVVLFWPLLIPGLIISRKALAAERENPGILQNGNYGLAKAGSIIAIVGIAIMIVAIIVLVALLSNGAFII